MNRIRRAAAVAATLVSLSGVVGLPAAAAPDDTSRDAIARLVAPEATPPARSTVDIAAVADASAARTPPATPDATAEQCLANEASHSEGGLYLNRFVWCQRATLAWQFPGDAVPGTVNVDFRAVAYGRDDSRRSATVFFKADDVTFYDSEPDATPDTRMEMRVCEAQCGGEAEEGAVAKPLKNWKDGWTRLNEITSDPVLGFGRDKVAVVVWKLRATLLSPGGNFANELPTHRLRCDSALYFGEVNKNAACIHKDVSPNLRYSVQDEAIKANAEHIRCAFTPSCVTDPFPERTDKVFPGNYADAGTDRALGLHRIVANASNREYVLNGRVVESTCRSLPADRRPGPGEQCDEYPFRSTKEGAATTIHDYSVKAVPAAQNGCAGIDLNRFYRLERILQDDPQNPYYDEFFVNIVDAPAPPRNGCTPDPDAHASPGRFDDWTFDGDGDPPPANSAPSVSAGPDVEGAEGSDIVLAGSVSDAEQGDPAIRWTYSVVSGADEGARCTFGSTTTARTTVSCTDEGVYRLTLRADDGREQASSTTTLTVRNAPPVLAGTPKAPKPWQVLGARTAVALDAPFADGGTNDRHTCTTTWDDGTAAQTYPATRGSCAARHTFARAGMYTIRTHATDDDGARSERPAEVLVVVYDRAGGPAAEVKGIFPTPPGAVSADPALSGGTTVLGKAAYLPGGRGPRPELGLVDVNVLLRPFSLHTDPLLTSETRLDWLVVTPEGRMAIRGTARVNGARDFGFVLYGWRGDLFRQQPDRLRLVSWPLSAGENPGARLTYDNARGAGFDLDDAPPPPVTIGLTLTLTLPTGGDPPR